MPSVSLHSLFAFVTDGRIVYKSNINQKIDQAIKFLFSKGYKLSVQFDIMSTSQNIIQ